MAVLLGVDFGTSNTVAVLRFPDGRSRPLLFDGSPVMPSAVFAEDSALLIGRDAEHSARIHPDRFEPNPKRRIDEGTVLLGEHRIEVVDLFAAVLRRVWGEANRISGSTPIAVTLTHPAAWGTERTGVLLEAARRAGMGTPKLVPEPVAAAAYFVDVLDARVPVGGCMVVYDFGAGTFDATVIRREPGGFAVLASEGLNDAGGLDIDAAIASYLGATIITRDPAAWQRLDRPETDADRRAHRLFWEDVRAAKELLSRTAASYVHVPIIEESLPIGREQVETLARPVLDRTVAATRLAIRRAGLAETAPVALFLVGGSSRIPLASTLLHRGLGIVPSAVEQPELVVADGSVHTGAVAVPGVPDAAPVSGLPISGLPVSGQPVSGYPLSGQPVSGYPVSGQPVSGYPVSGQPVSGYPASGVPISGLPASGAPVGGQPLLGQPMPGQPVAGQQMPGPSMPGQPMPGAGGPGAGGPGAVGQFGPRQAPTRTSGGQFGAPTQGGPYAPPGQGGQFGMPPVSGQPGPTSGPPGTGQFGAPATGSMPVPGQFGRPGGAPTGSGQLGAAGSPVTGWGQQFVPPPAPKRRGRAALIVVPAVAVVLVGALVGALVLKPWQKEDKPAPPGRTTQPISYTAADNSGPAARPADAVRGGRLTVLSAITLDHLDPAQAYQFQEIAVSQLVSRTLTTLRPNDDGSSTLVGDLATDPGQDVNSDCRVWRFTLRDGVKFADGTPVTAQDVAYGIGRSFQSDVEDGFVTLQQWLAGSDNYDRDYDGPGTGNEPAPGVRTPDSHTVELHFAQPHCDAPYAAALPTTAAVPNNSRPSATALDTRPPATGPYQVNTQSDKSVTLIRNPSWDPATDPLRTADPDEIAFTFGMSTDDISAKLVADHDADQRTISWSATNTAAARNSGRVRTGSLGYNVLLGINNARLTSLKVRQAISYAIDKTKLVGESIGSDGGVPASTVIAPGMAGYVAAPDQYPYSPDKARDALGSGFAKGTKLTLATSTSSARGRQATQIKRDLEAIGFSVTVVQLESTDLFTKLDDADDPYDLAVVGYVPDWPSGFEQLRGLFSTDPAWNFAHLNDSAVHSEISRIEKLPAAKQIEAAGALDAKIIADHAAVVPLFTTQGSFLYGSHVSAVPVNSPLAVPDLFRVYVS